MSLLLQQILHEIERLSPRDQWQVMEHLMNQLKHAVNNATHASEATVENHEMKQVIGEIELAEVDRLLEETSGIWGRMSREEIDAQLERQRKFDWGE